MKMKPIEVFEAERAYRASKPVFAFDRSNGELIHINKMTNLNAILNMFSQPYYLFYIYEEEK